MSRVTKDGKRVAIMGGTFDPVHMGHLVTAEAVRHEFNIDEVLFVPTGNPPHKASVHITSAEHRYLMTELATADNKYFRVSKIEIERLGKTYTIDTIKELQKVYGKGTKLYFITGADAIQEILTWKNSEDLLRMCTFVAVTRPGYHKEALIQQVENLRLNYGSTIQFLEVPALSISSSDIRKRVKENRPVKYLVTDAVEKYIMKHYLYTQSISFDHETIEELTHYVKSCLSEKRYQHTKGVVEKAMELANIYGVNTDHVFIAALFHDVAKELTHDEIESMCKQFNVTLDSFEKQHLDLVHGKIGAAILSHKWGIHNDDILNSITYHTTGRMYMSDMEKIIYLADMTEKGRKYFDGLEKIRRLSEKDLSRAMYEALITSKHYVKHVMKKEVHPKTYELIAHYKPDDI